MVVNGIHAQRQVELVDLVIDGKVHVNNIWRCKFVDLIHSSFYLQFSLLYINFKIQLLFVNYLSTVDLRLKALINDCGMNRTFSI